MGLYLKRYGRTGTVSFPMIKRGVVDFAVSTDWTPAAGDCTISKDDGTEANTTNLPAAVQASKSRWKLVLTAAELSAKRIDIRIIDLTNPKAVEDQAVIILTYGDANAEHVFDFALSNAIAASAPSSYGALNEVDQIVYQSTAGPALTWTILDSSGAAIDVSAMTLAFYVYKLDGASLFTVTSGITVAVNVVGVPYTAANTATLGNYRYELRAISPSVARMLAIGDLQIRSTLGVP